MHTIPLLSSAASVLETVVLILNHPKYKKQIAMVYCTPVTQQHPFTKCHIRHNAVWRLNVLSDSERERQSERTLKRCGFSESKYLLCYVLCGRGLIKKHQELLLVAEYILFFFFTPDDRKIVTLALELISLHPGYRSTRITVFLDNSPVNLHPCKDPQSMISSQCESYMSWSFRILPCLQYRRHALFAAYHVVQIPAPTCHVIPCIPCLSSARLSIVCQSVVQPAGQLANQLASQLVISVGAD